MLLNLRGCVDNFTFIITHWFTFFISLDVELPMEIKDGDDLKDWFISQGWVPTMHNFKRKEKCGGIVLNAIKFKLVLRMFAVIKRGTPYVETDAYKN